MTTTSELKNKLRWLQVQRKVQSLLNRKGRVESNKKYKIEKSKFQSLLQETVIKETFGANVQSVVFETYNGTIISDIKDVQINKELGTGAFNKQEIEVLKPLFNREGTLYIVGTHIGTLLVPLSKVVKQVAGFEANPKTFGLLQQNIRLNAVSNAEVFNYAVCESEKKLSFYQNKANSGGSKIRPKVDNYIYNFDNPDVIEIEGKTLDNLAADNQLAYPDYIVMDIEGSEYFALQGADKCLNSAKLLYVEFEPHHLDNVAGVTVKSFLELIMPHFNSMKLMSDLMAGKDIVYEKGQVLQMLEQLYKSGEHNDLLFFK